LCNFDRLSSIRMLGVLDMQVKIMLLGRELDEQQLQLALQFGARGAIGKGSSPELLIKSIRAVASGEYWFDRATLMSASRTRTAPTHDVSPTLTRREMEIVSEIVAGSSNAQIAARLHISEETVKRHLANVYAKLGVSNRLQLALLAVGNSASKAAVA
jgi:DNA-binding NarL/FixJ family response regulator